MLVVYIRKVKKSESKSQHMIASGEKTEGLCISVKLKNLKANHNGVVNYIARNVGCVYP